MAYRLTTESVDDDIETAEFATLDEAIEAGRKWFVEGYDNKTIGPKPHWLDEDAIRLVDDLRAGREFRCGGFHERISVGWSDTKKARSG